MHPPVTVDVSARNIAPVLSVPALRPAAAAALDVTPQEIIARWLGGLSEGSQRSYRRSLRRFAAWLLVDDARPERALEALCGLDVGPAGEVLRHWCSELEQSGLASASVSTYVTSILSLLGACRRAGLIPWKLERIRPRVEHVESRSGPRRGDVERLFSVIDDAADKGDALAVRDRALLRLLYSAALRRSEALTLRLPQDVDLDAEGGAVVRPKRKGYRERRPVVIPPGCRAAIARWLDERGREPGWLFCRLRGRTAESGHLNGETLRRRLRLWTKRAGIDIEARPIRCHGLRHSAASTVARNGSLSQLLALGGWSSLTSAKRYLDDLNEDRLAAMRLVDI